MDKSVAKDALLAPSREEIDLTPLGLSGSVWVRSLGAGPRADYIDSLFDASGAWSGKGGRERLLALTVERVEDGAFVLALASEAEARDMRPDVAEVLFEVAQRLSLIREQDRAALKKVFSVVPSGAGPTTSPNDSGTPQ